MSDEFVVGHVSWSPDFKSKPEAEPEWLKKALDAGTVKFAPKWKGEKLVSVDIVSADPAPQEEAPDLRPHRLSEIDNVVFLEAGDLTHQISFTYTNWKGVTKKRRAVINRLFWGNNEFHPVPQLLVDGYDLDKTALRTYALKDITDVQPLA